jgi:acyl-CoA reductase-like NAD-dependent aldehyde dehydrogenase
MICRGKNAGFFKGSLNEFKAATMDIDWLSRYRSLTLEVRNFIDGRWRSLEGADAIEKWSSRDGSLICRFPGGDLQQADDAVASARRAFEDGRWSKLPVQRRKDILYKLAALIEEHHEEFALLECVDVGKPISDALGIDVPAAAATIKFNAEVADKCYGSVYAADHSSLSYQLRRPLGVVAGIIGWNFPLLLAAGKIGPALATGNSLVLKPSELTSFSAARVAELAIEAGVPEGVLNVVHGGAAIGAALAHHQDVGLVTFTGSSSTGKSLLVASGQSNMKRLMLECGGKSPNVVFDDSPALDTVAEAIVARAFWNQGQVCTASSRLLVQHNIKEELLRRVIDKSAALQPRDPLMRETRFGALVSQAHQKKVLNYIAAAKDEGAKLAYEGDWSVPVEAGFYVPPVIFDDVTSDQRIAREEIFGPVLSVMSFRDEKEAVKIANSTNYGLSAILWTKDLARAHRVTHGVSAGWITVNATDKPMGGPGHGVLSVGGHKESGIGTEGGGEGLEAYMSRTAVQLFV